MSVVTLFPLYLSFSILLSVNVQPIMCSKIVYTYTRNEFGGGLQGCSANSCMNLEVIPMYMHSRLITIWWEHNHRDNLELLWHGWH